MVPTLLPRDLLVAAKNRVTHVELQLEAVREETRRLKERVDWLADRPDLLNLDHILLELEKEVPFYRWLHKKLKASTSEGDLESLLKEPQLDKANKKIIAARIESLRTREGWISFDRIITDCGASSVSYLGYTPACWETYIRLVDERLQSSEQARNELRRDHLSEIEQHIASRIEKFGAEQIRDAQAALDAANLAYEAVRSQCFSQFRSRVKQDFLAARIEDFAPFDDSSFRQQLEDAKSIFVREWASRHTRATLDLEQASPSAPSMRTSW